MGSGCSSPLRRLGGKRGKQTQRDSISEIIGDKDDPERLTIAAKIQAEQNKEAANLGNDQRCNLNLENEITVQSEANEDHPSSASYYTDGKNAAENGQKLAGSDQVDPNQAQKGPSSAAARMMGLTGAIPNDRHLLVSPALSPAPSVCQSPAPTSSYAGCPVPLDLNDLEEAFMTLTFGLPDGNNQPAQIQHHHQSRRRIKRPTRTTRSDLYNQQLLQSREDLTQNVSVVFIASDNITENVSKSVSCPNSIDQLANQIEASLRSICDDHSYNMRFLNLSQDHLVKNLFVNNLQEVARRLLEEEYRENGHRMLVIMLANSNSSLGTSDSGQDEASKQQAQNDKRQLPTRIDVQVMNKLVNQDPDMTDQKSVELLRLWYNQVGGVFYLKPIYSVQPKISSKSREERESAWQSWLADSNMMIKYLVSVCSKNADLGSELAPRSLFNTYTDFVISEPALQRRTLLIRNYSGLIVSNQHAHQVMTPAANKLNDLARLLADPCKLTQKHTSSEADFATMANDWISENFSKYLDNFIENRITSGKCVPPFIERNLFIELTRQRHYLEHYLNSITENFETRCQSFYTSQIQPILAKLAEVPSESASSINLSSSSHSLASQPAANHLVFISGPKGCGKTTLFAQMIRNCVQELANRVQIIYRFCGLTIDSLNSNRLLRSICEQFCQMQGENTTAASYIYSSRRKELMDAIGKLVKMKNVLIFLDGINVLNDPTETCLEWLCEIEASSHIRIIMTLETDTELYKKILNTYTDATFIILNNPTGSEWAHMLTSAARSHRYNSSGNLYEELKQLDPSNSNEANVNFEDAFDVLNMCRMRILNNEHLQPELSTKLAQMNSIESFKKVHQVIFSYSHYLLPPYLFCSLLVALDSSRNGLSELELIEIMSLIGRKYYDSKQGFKFSSSLLNYLKFHLRPWLRVIICGKVVRLTVRKDMLAKAIEFYVPTMFSKIVSEVREILENYYSKSWKQAKRGSKVGLGGDNADSSPNRIKDHVNYAESIWLDIQASEMMNLLILTNPSKAKSNILNKQAFYLQFLWRSIPEEFVEDCDRLRALLGRKSSQSCEELQNLVNYVKQSIFSLMYDGSQIYSQIYCRSFETLKVGSKSTKSKKFNEILTTALCPPIWSLLPASEASIESFIKTRIGQVQPPPNKNGAVQATSSNIPDLQRSSVLPSNQLRQPNGPVNAYQQASRQKIFTIKENHRHVIAIYPDKNSLAVWDIFEERAVRIINDIDHPRDLRMIDQRRAVILCNRELRVYDLDSGTMVTKLKGVMNQKMPYFEIFGQNYVIALARNRMYVNMLNINTGELETTFKVGEDRFLNSLLVSADGGICVCGDETQKPFPLLVWNLNERRLMYDLRLDRHEFITRMSAISDDGHFVVSVCRQLGDSNVSSSSASSSVAPNSSGAHKASSPNFIVIYDLNSGTLFKKWKPGLDTCGVAISLSSNRSGKLINSITDSSILVWDLTTGSKK